MVLAGLRHRRILTVSPRHNNRMISFCQETKNFQFLFSESFEFRIFWH